MSCICDCILRCRRRQGYENLDEEPTPPLRRSTTITLDSDTVTVGREGRVFSRKEEGGYVLRIPEGALRDEVDVTVNVRYPAANETHSLPEGSDLVSAVYHITSKETELEKSGCLVIEHCITIKSAQDRESLCVVTRKRRRGSSNGSHDHLQYVDDGDIFVRSDCVEVKLRRLGSMSYAAAFAQDRRGAVGYCGMLYRMKLEAGLAPSTKFVFMVVKDLNFYIKAVDDHCVAKSLEKAYEPMPIIFEAVPQGEEMKLTLDMKKEGIRNKGWRIYSCFGPAEILERDAYNYLPNNCSVPSLELQVVWEGSLQPAPGPDRLLEFIDIKGTVRPKSLTLQCEPGKTCIQQTSGANDPTVPKMPELIKCVGQKGKHNIPEEIGPDYGIFGILLLNDTNGTKVCSIEWQYHRHPEAINREILRQWLEGKGRQRVTWATLIQVLREMKKNTLAEDIEKGLMGREIYHF